MTKAQALTLEKHGHRGLTPADTKGPEFDVQVPSGGYAWWYVDGISDDGLKAISIISFVGAVFSPWYHWSGRTDPENHCSVNVVTYGRGGRFAMTDRRSTVVTRQVNELNIGPSSMVWNGQNLIIDIDEVSSWPLISRMKGRITIEPKVNLDVELPLSSDGAHIWRPFAPIARINVELNNPAWQWSGNGYVDSNRGTRRLEDDFSRWTWARFPTKSGALCMYSIARCDGSEVSGSVDFSHNGQSDFRSGLSQASLPKGRWGLKRAVGSDSGVYPRQVMPMLEGPFYNRCLVQTEVDGERLTGVHETLDLRRYKLPVVKWMLATRIPRKWF